MIQHSDMARTLSAAPQGRVARRGYDSTGMDVQLSDLLRELEETSRQRGGVPRIEREGGQFLNLLVKIAHAQRILEIGTADGYATLWLADAAAAVDGQITTMESDVWHVANAQKLFDRSPHRERIRLVQGKAEEVLPVLEGPFDFVLIDANKTEALHFFHILAEKLSSGAVICCDKAIAAATVLAPYLTYVHDRPGLESILVPVGEGIEVTYKVP